MKKLLWTSAIALAVAACFTACDDSSSSGNSNEIPSYKAKADLPDTCELEVAKVDTSYYACLEDKWIEVKDSVVIEKIKNGIDEEELEKELKKLLRKKSSSSTKPESSSSVTEGDENEESSSSSEEVTDDPSSDSKKKEKNKEDSSSGSSGGSGSGEGGDSSPSSTDSSSPSSTDSSDDSSPSSTDSSDDSSPSSAETSSPSSGTSTETCGTATYNPETHFCRPRDNAVIAIADAGCCDDGRTCHYYSYTDYPNTYYDRNKEFCDNRTGADYRIYKMVTIGTQTWMAENLKYKTEDAVYFNENKDGDYTARGYFYRYADVNNSNSRICPNGWHVPSANEWKSAITAVIGNSNNPADFIAKVNITFDGYAFGESATFWYDATHGNSEPDDGVTFWTSEGEGAYFHAAYNSVSASYSIDGRVYTNDRYPVRCVQDKE